MKKIVKEIQKLKKEKNAVILVHNYQIPEVQEIADFLGDSLGLSQKATNTQADVIVFCGVDFMAETASILSPDKKVLLPVKNAGCPMAEMVNTTKIKRLKQNNPNAPVVSYVNTSAEVKAESDICCTSANGVRVINSLKENKVIFTPDKYLGDYISRKTEKKVILSDGYCPVHTKILPEDVKEKRKKHPEAKVMVHPECTSKVIDLADEVLSTSGMCIFAKENESKEIIVGTEKGIIYRLEKESPSKKFYPLSESAICRNMKKNSLENVLWALKNMEHEVSVKEETRKKAKNAVDKMIKL